MQLVDVGIERAWPAGMRILLAILPVLLFSFSACNDEALGVGEARAAGDGGAADLAPVVCNTFTDEASCTAHPECRAASCAGCAQPLFGCIAKDAPWIGCPIVECSQACGQHQTADACTADGACYPVSRDPGTCDCNTPGCCLQFHHCADKPVACTATSTCGTLDCGPSYATVYENGCPTGCAPKYLCESDG